MDPRPTFDLPELLRQFRQKFNAPLAPDLLAEAHLLALLMADRPDELPALLAPLLARDAEQDRFIRAFALPARQVIKEADTPTPPSVEPEQAPEREQEPGLWQRLRRGLAKIWHKPERDEPPEPDSVPQSTPEREALTVRAVPEGWDELRVPVRAIFEPPPWPAALRAIVPSLRAREQDQEWEFAPLPSLRATLRAGGLFQPVFQPRTRPAAYLVLIDRPHPNALPADHAERFFQLLLARDVPAERYFFRDLPDRLTDPSGKERSLKQLLSRHHSDFLLLFTHDGQHLLGPDNGWATRARDLAHWPRKALLTTLRPELWDYRQRALHQRFGLMLHADSRGLALLRHGHERLSERPEARPGSWRPDPDGRFRLPEPLRPWAAACAIWPQVLPSLAQWLAPTAQGTPPDADDFLRLAQLPWAARGYFQQAERTLLAEGCDDDTRRKILERLKQAVRQSRLAPYAGRLILSFKPKDLSPADKALPHDSAAALAYVNQLELADIDLGALKQDLEALIAAAQKGDWDSGGGTPTLPNIPEGFVLIPGGTFAMGSEDGDSDEKPVHEVSDFMMGKYPVTQRLWQEVMGENPSHFKDCPECPVEEVNWYDAVEFCNKLSEREGLRPCYAIDKTRQDPNNQNSSDKLKWTITCDWTANGYRLPTEAEWEYAAGGGSSGRTKWAGTDSEAELVKFAWYNKNSESKTHPVRKLAPNGLGLYDMSGNVWEWCWDWKGDYASAAQPNPQGPLSGSCRVLRGGSWFDRAIGARVAYRSLNYPDSRGNISGFRLVLPLSSRQA